MSMFDILMSVISGGATGLIGTALSLGADYLKRKQDIELEKTRADNNIAALRVQGELIDKEWGHRLEVSKVEQEGKENESANASFAASFSLEPKSYSEKVKPTRGQGWVLVLVDAVRGIVRPGLTVYLCVLTTLIYFQSRDLLSQENLDVLQAMDITTQVINTILYLTTTVVLWWFGTRNKSSAPAGRAA